MSVQPTSDTLADPGGILVELGQSGGPHPSDRLPVTGILARQLAQAGIDIEEFADLAPFHMLMLHPGRTLLEKLLRVNNFVIDEARRSDHDGRESGDSSTTFGRSLATTASWTSLPTMTQSRWY